MEEMSCLHWTLLKSEEIFPGNIYHSIFILLSALLISSGLKLFLFSSKSPFLLVCLLHQQLHLILLCHFVPFPSTCVSTVLTLLIPSRCICTIWVLSSLMDLQHLWWEKSWIYIFSSNPPFNYRLENATAFLTFLLIYDCLVGISNLDIQSDSFNLHPTLIPNSPPSPVLPPQCIALSLIQLIVNSHTHTHIWRHTDSSSLTSLSNSTPNADSSTLKIFQCFTISLPLLLTF